MALFRLNAAPKFSIIAAFAVAIMLGLGIGNGTFQPEAAHAAGQLEIEGSCEPASVRPNETALIHCTVTLTNTGDEALTDLTGSVFIAEGCNLPGRFAFIERRSGDELILTEPLGLIFDVPDLAAGETATNVTRTAVENYSTGLTGGSVTISSASKPDATATINLCWNVQDDALAPATNLTVTKTALGTTGDVIFLDEPEAPPRPTGGEPVPILPPPPPTGIEMVEFEIAIVNVSDITMSDVTLLDVPTGDAVFVSAEPSITGFDSLGRPVWNIGDLAPGEAFSVIATYGPPADGNCSFADDIAIVEATPDGGEREDYVAFSDFGVPVGPCEFIAVDYCSFYPPDGDFPVTDSCDSDVCWTTSPDGFTWPVFDCSGDVSYCWFTAPGDGGPSLSPCDASVCWVSFGGNADYEFWGEVPCDAEFCQYTSPDGNTTQSDCTIPICWAEDPVGGFWQQIYGAEGIFGTSPVLCVAPGGAGPSVRRSGVGEVLGRDGGRLGPGEARDRCCGPRRPRSRGPGSADRRRSGQVRCRHRGEPGRPRRGRPLGRADHRVRGRALLRPGPHRAAGVADAPTGAPPPHAWTPLTSFLRLEPSCPTNWDKNPSLGGPGADLYWYRNDKRARTESISRHTDVLAK